MSVKQGLTKYYREFGVLGVLAISGRRIFGIPTELTVRPPGIRYPVNIRLRTTDDTVYKHVLVEGEYAFDLPFAPKTVVDVGANIGMASIYFAHRYPEARIIAVEPEASNFALLARNVRPYPAITPIQAALWSRDGEISINDPDPRVSRPGKSGFVTREGSGVAVRAISMESLMRATGISSVDLLKVDIEGAEKEVFEACDWIGSVGCLMIESHDRYRPGCSQAVDSAMRGFSKTHRGETTFYIRRS